MGAVLVSCAQEIGGKKKLLCFLTLFELVDTQAVCGARLLEENLMSDRRTLLHFVHKILWSCMIMRFLEFKNPTHFLDLLQVLVTAT